MNLPSKLLLASSIIFTTPIYAETDPAEIISFSGNITYHNDVIYTYFTIDDTSDVSVWTNSYKDGENFDPITALWDSNGNLIDQNDDNSGIKPSDQTVYDSGFYVENLVAGDYIFTVATYSNWAASSVLSDGFNYDSETPLTLAEWCQPAAIDECTNLGPFWQVNLEGVDEATNPSEVPVPAAAWLFGTALAGLVLKKRK